MTNKETRKAARRFARASYFAALFLGYCSLAQFYPSPALLLARECRARSIFELACGFKELAAAMDTSRVELLRSNSNS